MGLLLLGLGRWLAPAGVELARTSGLFGMLAALVLGTGCRGTTGAAGTLTALEAARTTAIVAWPSIHRGAEELGVCSDRAPCWVTGGAQPCAGPSSGDPADAGSSPPTASGAGVPAQDGGL